MLLLQFKSRYYLDCILLATRAPADFPLEGIGLDVGLDGGGQAGGDHAGGQDKDGRRQAGHCFVGSHNDTWCTWLFVDPAMLSGWRFSPLLGVVGILWAQLAWLWLEDLVANDWWDACLISFSPRYPWFLFAIVFSSVKHLLLLQLLEKKTSASESLFPSWEHMELIVKCW